MFFQNCSGNEKAPMKGPFSKRNIMDDIIRVLSLAILLLQAIVMLRIIYRVLGGVLKAHSHLIFKLYQTFIQTQLQKGAR